MKIVNHLFIIIVTIITFPFSLIGLLYIAMFELRYYVFEQIKEYHNEIINKFNEINKEKI